MHPQLVVVHDVEKHVTLGYSNVVFEVIQGLRVERDSKNGISKDFDGAVDVVRVRVKKYIELGRSIRYAPIA
jgi:hypothetical protein